MQVVGPATSAYFSGSVENGDYHWVDDFPVDWLARGIVTDLAHVYRGDSQFPSYTSDLEHSWCLIYMEFVKYVVLRCPSNIAERVVASLELEVLYLN